MYESFNATIQLALCCGEVEVIEVNGEMVICTGEYPVYITKEQAMKFFNLIPKE